VPGRALTVRIPPDARTSELLFVGEANAIVPSRDPFVIIAAPMITGFSPRVARVGDRVDVAGKDFTPRTEVLLGGRSLPIVERDGPHRIVVQIPADHPPGKAQFTVRDGDVESARW